VTFTNMLSRWSWSPGADDPIVVVPAAQQNP